MHLTHTAGCQISTLIFGFGFGLTLYISQEKLPNDGKVLCPLGLMSQVLPGSLTDISG